MTEQGAATAHSTAYGTEQSRRFLLLGLSVSILMLLAIYLLDLFSVRSFGSESIVLLFAGAVIALLVADGAMGRYGISNPLYFAVPVAAALFVCYAAGFRSIAVAFALMMATPAIVATMRWFVGKGEGKKK